MDRGSLVNLLAVWRAHGVDKIMRECWESGVVLGSESAGSLCWFQAAPLILMAKSGRSRTDSASCRTRTPSITSIDAHSSSKSSHTVCCRAGMRPMLVPVCTSRGRSWLRRLRIERVRARIDSLEAKMAKSTRNHWSCSASSGSRAQPRYDGSDIVAAVPPLQDGNSSLHFSSLRADSDPTRSTSLSAWVASVAAS